MDKKLTSTAADVFVFSSEYEYLYGFIGLADIEERFTILDWLLDTECQQKDPRLEQYFQQSTSILENSENSENVTEKTAEAGSDPDIVEFVTLGINKKWHFIKGDSDYFPSIPHGHLNAKTQSWPKLNPYTGRCHNGKNCEDASLRLSRNDMILLWNNKNFRTHCLEQIAWYRSNYPNYRFPVPAHRLFKLPKWR